MTSYGISLLPDTTPQQRSAGDYYTNLLTVSELVENLGLEYVKMTEHYLHPYGGYCPDPLAFLSAVAARTSRIRLMTGGIQASFHHPIQLAARTAQLDALSNGRLDVGFARAFLPYEFDSFGIDLDSSKDRFRATVDAVVRLWTESDVSEDTPFFRYRAANSLPLPTQEPHPPVWAAALLTRSSFEWIGDAGHNLLIASAPSREQVDQVREMIDLYRARFRAAPGNAGREPRVAISVALYLAETDQEAIEEGTAALRRHWDVFGSAANAWRDRTSSSYEGYREAVVDKHQAGPSEDAGLAVVGSPQTAIEQLRHIEQELDTDIVLFQLDFGQQPLESMERSLKLFASEVRPYLGSTR
ncbi:MULTISPECIES: LLM class flavin-dependent oxidoreductase [unclassified Embleya]|uniref:LLM class flavin-dependent oxidoreductase n=1 Tax=unclassified Embleya TaxID=2699296 RepID=UPI0033F25B9D